MTEPIDSRDKAVDEDVRRNLLPDVERAWRCHRCNLIYGDRGAHDLACPERGAETR